MSRIRRSIALVAVAATVPMLVAATPSQGAGAARTTLALLQVEGTALPVVGDTAGSLGVLELLAANHAGDAASATLGGLSAAGKSLGSWSRSTAGGPQRGDHSIPIDVVGLAGRLDLAGYDLTAADGLARAHLAALSGRLATGPFGLSVGLGPNGITTTASRQATSTAFALVLDGLDLTLGDLLPAGLLDALPLGSLIDLAGTPGLPIPADLRADAAAILDLLDQLEDVDGVLGGIEQRRSQLRDLLPTGADGAVAAAESAVASAEAALASAKAPIGSLQAAVDTATGQLSTAKATLAGAQAAIPSLTSAVSSASSADAAADAAVAAATSALSSAQGERADAQSAVAAATSAVASAQATVDGLLAQLASLPLLSPLLGSLNTQLSAANAVLSTAKATLATAQTQLSAAVSAVTAATQALSSAQSAAASTQSALSSATAALAGGNQQVTAATGQVTEATAARDAATGKLTSALAGVVSAENTLAGALASLDALVASLSTGDAADAVLAQLQGLRGQLDGLLGQLDTLLGGLPDLTSLVDDLRDAIADAPLLELDATNIVIDLLADAERGRANIVCDTAGVTVLGVALPAADCEALARGIDEVDRVVGDVIGSLPTGGVPAVSIDGLEVSDSASDAPVDRITRAAVAITGLRIEIPSVGLVDGVDGVTASLRQLASRGQAAAALAGTPIGGLATGMTPLAVDRLKPSAASFKPAAVGDLPAQLDGLQGDLGTMPSGGSLGGLQTPGLVATVGDLASEVAFTTAAGGFGDGGPFPSAPGPVPPGAGGGVVPNPAPVPGGGGPDAGAPDGDGPGGGAPDGGDPDGDGPGGGAPDLDTGLDVDLPRTGGGVGLVAFALAAGAARLRRRP